MTKKILTILFLAIFISIFIYCLSLYKNDNTFIIGKSWQKDLKLKVDKSKILSYRVIKEYRYIPVVGSLGNATSSTSTVLEEIPTASTSIVEYEYISTSTVPTILNEIVDKRTDNSQTIDLGNGKYKLFYYVNDRFKYDDGDWREIKYATTTLEAYEDQTAQSFSNKIKDFVLGFPVNAEISTSSTNNKDTGIQKVNPNTNYGTDVSVYVYNNGSTADNRMLIDFTMPSGSGTISDVKLYGYNGDNNGTNNQVLNAYQLSRTGWTEAGATWNKYDGTNAWTSAGGDYNASIVDSLTCDATGNKWRSWVLMGTGSDNPLTLTWGSDVNIILVHPSSPTGYIEIFTKNYTTDVAKQPYLEITYSSSIPTLIPNIINFE